MDGFLSNSVKYLLFFTNFSVLILGLVVFGLGIWVLVDKPTFLALFEQWNYLANLGQKYLQAQDVGLEDLINVELYNSAVYVLLVVAFLVALIAFLGCCGAIKENRCMLATYFILVLAMFIVMVVGAVLGYSGNLEETIKRPLNKALLAYDDNPSPNSPKEAYKNIWNKVQSELKCCGVESVEDWKQAGSNFNWTPSASNKPEGCCEDFRSGEDVTNDAIRQCREAQADRASESYYFEGCFTKISNQIKNNQLTVVGVAIFMMVFMLPNMLFSFTMCIVVNQD